jgi:DNA-binding transcriptional LysR family regulator
LMAATLMPRVIHGYRQVFPDVEVRLSDTLPEQTLDKLVSGEAEIAIGPDTGASADFTRQPLLRDRHLLICPPDHPLTRKKRIRWKDVAAYPFIAPTRDFMKRLAPELALADGAPVIEPVHEVSYMTTAIGMVAGGLGVTACPSYSRPLAQGYGLEMRVLVDPEFYREVSVYSLANRSLSHAAESFVEFMRSTKPDQLT